MAKVHGIHEIVLKPGARGEDLERLFAQEVMAAPQPQGVRVHLWKGDRGKRAGQYALVFEIDSVEQRDRNYPTEESASDEVQRIAEAQRAMVERWASLASLPDDEETGYTDYVTVGE